MRQGVIDFPSLCSGPRYIESPLQSMRSGALSGVRPGHCRFPLVEQALHLLSPKCFPGRITKCRPGHCPSASPHESQIARWGICPCSQRAALTRRRPRRLRKEARRPYPQLAQVKMNGEVAGLSPPCDGLRDAVAYDLVKGRLGFECPFHHPSPSGPKAPWFARWQSARPSRTSRGRAKGE